MTAVIHWIDRVFSWAVRNTYLRFLWALNALGAISFGDSDAKKGLGLVFMLGVLWIWAKRWEETT